MAILGPILKEVVRRRRERFDQRKVFSFADQERVLKKLITKSRNTAFGRHYNFPGILTTENLIEAFQQQVPIHTYESMYSAWWQRTLNDEEDVSWPGKIKYYALTSGTSQAASKKIPLSNEMIRATRKVGLRHSNALDDIQLSKDFFESRVLMLGGSSKLTREMTHFTGDLSGILFKKLPLWLHGFYKPGRKIGSEKDWGIKLEKIIQGARQWDIGIISGNPAWLQIMMEKIIEHYRLKNIHQIWPNLKIFLHGGVSIKPYISRLEKLFGEEVYYLETYLASEGFLATQSAINEPMKLVVDEGIFFEFIPFNKENFNSEGELLDNPQVLSLNNVKDSQEYAILISTCAGAWRYLIGDTIRFHNASNFEISITGRTKHHLSLCGEHLSVDNMSDAIVSLSRELGIDIHEFTVIGLPFENLFAHKWYIGMDEPADPAVVRELLDTTLKSLNDDYRLERQHALKEVMVEVLPHNLFYSWLKNMGKEGGQHKFPRVLNYDQYTDWLEFIDKNRDKAASHNEVKH